MKKKIQVPHEIPRRRKDFESLINVDFEATLKVTFVVIPEKTLHFPDCQPIPWITINRKRARPGDREYSTDNEDWCLLDGQWHRLIIRYHHPLPPEHKLRKEAKTEKLDTFWTITRKYVGYLTPVAGEHAELWEKLDVEMSKEE